MAAISRERAERIARAHPCEQCGAFSFKRLTVRPSSPEHQKELKEVWLAVMVCGVCWLYQELGIDEESEILYVA